MRAAGINSVQEAPGDPIKLPFISPACPAQIAEQKQWELPRFLRIEKVGSGMASSVYLAVDACTRAKVALKVYDKRQLTEPLLRGVMSEISIHGRMVHPHVLAMYAAFEDGHYLAIVLDYAGEGDLYRRLPGIRREEHAVAKYIIAPLLSALATLHNQRIIHRDLKPENILLKASHIYLSDFGFSINCKTSRPVTRLGTTHFMAPELILHEPDKPDGPLRDKVPRPVRHEYGCQVDIWVVGAITYETLLHRPPFDGPKEPDVIRDILRNKPHYPSTLSEEARDFLRKCLTYDAHSRPNATELYEHPFICKSMPREKWEVLHPSNFMTIELAKSSMREHDLLPSPEQWEGVPTARMARRDSLTAGTDAPEAAEPIRERRKAVHSQFAMQAPFKGISPSATRVKDGSGDSEGASGRVKMDRRNTVADVDAHVSVPNTPSSFALGQVRSSGSPYGQVRKTRVSEAQSGTTTSGDAAGIGQSMMRLAIANAQVASSSQQAT